MVSLGAVEDFCTCAGPRPATPWWPCPTRAWASASCWCDDRQGPGPSTIQAPREAGLPELMLPAEVMQVPELLLLGTGKTDYPSVQKLVTERAPAA
ncbi:MAG: hypothetical protein U1E17_01205 [Geminicoccaceae bacterium]